MQKGRRRFALLLFLIALILSVSGIIFVYTGSYFFCLKKGVPPHFYALKQGVAFVFGVILAFVIYRFFDYRKLASKKFLWGLYGIAIFLLVVVLIFGKEVNNSKSWIIVGGLSFQPAELAKVFVILFVSGYIKYKWYEIQSDFKVFIGFITLSFLPVLLILLEKDLGSAMILSIVIFAILFITGLDLKYILYPVGLGFIMFFLAVITAPYRLARIKILLDPTAYYHTSGKYDSYQLVQAFVAFAKGGITGMGLGQGEQSKLMFLTFPFSDFMYAHIAEETGFIGAALVLIAFFLILYLGLSISDRTDEKLGKYMALGLTLYIFLQAMVHIGVNLGVIPTTGITLPFMSLGGSSLVSTFIAIGFLMNIARFLPKEERINFKIMERGKYA
ncbi:MAG: putative peptidoglycan glycosyltransferase FtsW [Desulfurobacteriaceae bacterium]